MAMLALSVVRSSFVQKILDIIQNRTFKVVIQNKSLNRHQDGPKHYFISPPQINELAAMQNYY